MNRSEMYRRLRAHSEPWDMIVVGGGATGAGVAIDAATRGYRVLLVEQHDFGKGTSSRSTKLIHGGVRYLQRGNVTLVLEALREGWRLRKFTLDELWRLAAKGRVANVMRPYIEAITAS